MDEMEIMCYNISSAKSICKFMDRSHGVTYDHRQNFNGVSGGKLLSVLG